MRVGAVRAREHATLIAHLILGLVSYLPLLLTARGRLAADTRQAVYLDPGRFLTDALSMWDPSRDLGTVTHQNIVLVWPMGVYYRVAELLGVPVWLAQRAWTGTILFVAGAGVLYLARTLQWELIIPGRSERRRADRRLRLGPAVAAITYAMSPYVIQYGTRTSVLLLPWAALPWLIGLTIRALATRGWRHPALFALVVMSTAVNATALALSLLGPAVWVAWAVWGAREASLGEALRTIGRIILIGIPTSLWWVVALQIEARFGLPLLDFTETIDQVASTSSATEVVRGLGYWVPYLQQHDYPEVTGASLYLQRLPVLALQLGVVGLAVLGVGLTRWRHRTVFAGLLVVGTVISTGAYPPGDRSPLASLFHDVARSGGGLALRSTTRAAPLALLGLAVLLGAFVDALGRRARTVGHVAAVAITVVVVVLAPSVGTRGHMVDPLYSRPDELPDYWVDALAAADAQAGTGRLLEIPGTRYAAYRWGTTYEPVTAGYARTPTAWREQIPYGGAGSAELLVSLDNRLQEGRLEPSALAPVARLLGASLLLVRNDLAYERYDTIAPDRVWSLVSGQPPGLGAPQPFGPVDTNDPDPAHQRDDQPLPADPTVTYPALALVPVKDSPGLVTTAALASTVLLDGSGDGVIDAAAAGLLDGRAPVLYAGTTAGNPDLLRQVLNARTRIVLTDTNRRRVERWRTVKNTRGITLRADEDPDDVAGQFGGEAALDALPSDSRWQSVAAPRGATVSATRYGNPLWFEAGVRPAAALDGDPSTAWRVGPTVGGLGDRLTVELEEPLRTDHLTLTATDEGTQLTTVLLRFDGGPPERITLDASSRQPTGQAISFRARTFSRLQIELAATEQTAAGTPAEPIGIAELGLTGADGSPIRTDEVVRLPTALVDHLGVTSIDHPMAVVLTRLRGDTTNKMLFEEEDVLARALSLPAGRSFAVVGQASVADSASMLVAGCRHDLITVDGTPIPVAVLPAADGALRLEGCGAAQLAAGDHIVRSLTAGDVRVDRIVLSSEAGGTPSAVDQAGAIALPFVSQPDPASWRQRSTTSVQLRAPRTDGPSWIMLGQSLNDGWSATSDAAPIGDPILLNGFANGFLVNDSLPQDAVVDLTWTPQRAMTASLWLALAGVLTALALIVRGRAWSVAPPHSAEPNAVGPMLDAPWSARSPLSWPRVVGATLTLGAVSAAVIAPAWGVAVAAVVLLAGRLQRGHAVLLGGAVVALAAGLGSVVIRRADHQELNPYDFFSTLHFQHRITLFALALLAGDLVLSRARPRQAVVDPIDSARRWAATWSRDWDAPLEVTAMPRRRVGRRFALSCSAGLVPATALFTWLVTHGRWNILAWRPISDSYDAQAHALLGGHLEMPQQVLGIEAFVVDGRAYMYQGPFPALLRLPIAAITDGFDGRLAVVSMLLAFVVSGIAASALLWQVRTMLRGATPIDGFEAALIAGFTFSVTGGSVLLFLGSQVSVYHESAAWGIALGIASLAALVRHLVNAGRWSLALTSILATFALWSRASIGIGVVAALGLVAVGQATTWWRRRRAQSTDRLVESLHGRRPSSGRALVGALAACLLPVLAYVAVNEAKFGTVVSVPWDRQVFSQVSGPRRTFLEGNGGSFFGLQFVPTTAAAYLRPDALSLQDEFPWIGFRESSIGDREGYGGVLFDKVDATASVPVSFPLLGPLALFGLLAITTGLGRAGPMRLLVGPALGAAGSAATIFVFGFIAQRYLADVLPLLVLVGSAGLVVLVRVLSHQRRAAQVAVLGVMVALGLCSVGVTIAQALWYQHVYASPGSEATTRAFYERRADLPRLPVGDAPRVRQGATLPPWAPAGDLFVVGDCAGLYVSDGSAADELTKTSFKPITRTPAVGAHDLDVSFENLHADNPAPVLVGGDVSAPHVLSVERDGPGHVRFRFRGGGLDGTGPRVATRRGQAQHLEVAADPGTGLITVVLDGRVTFQGLYPISDVPSLGANDLDATTSRTFPGTLRERPPDDDLCRSLLGSTAADRSR